VNVSIRDITDPRDPAIASFGRVQRAVYFAPETLIPSEFIARMFAGDIGGGRGARRNFLVVAERDGKVVGGALFHWLADADSGFSSFMGVAREMRGHGIARRLHDERFRLLDEAAGHTAPGVFIDVVNPTRMSAEDLERERQAGFDPWTRRRAFEHLGFRQVDIYYEQPIGGPHGGPVTNLDLLYCPREPTDFVETSRVVATMRAYWSPWVPDAAGHARELGARARGATRLALLSPVPPKLP
jgi:GNAT superfamily N-acetyltransferase